MRKQTEIERSYITSITVQYYVSALSAPVLLIPIRWLYCYGLYKAKSKAKQIVQNRFDLDRRHDDEAYIHGNIRFGSAEDYAAAGGGEVRCVEGSDHHCE